jgi:hypothetical protein
MPFTVDCWIGVVVEDDRLVIRLEGRLSVAQVPELLKTWADTEPAELDLAELLSADVGGIEALRRIRDAGTALVGAPGYIKMKIESSEDSTADRHSPRGRGAG